MPGAEHASSETFYLTSIAAAAASMRCMSLAVAMSWPSAENCLEAGCGVRDPKETYPSAIELVAEPNVTHETVGCISPCGLGAGLHVPESDRCVLRARGEAAVGQHAEPPDAPLGSSGRGSFVQGQTVNVAEQQSAKLWPLLWPLGATLDALCTLGARAIRGIERLLFAGFSRFSGKPKKSWNRLTKSLLYR
jgi:hypothetical protein